MVRNSDIGGFLICRKSLNCRGVTDAGEGHAWNAITVNDNTYYFDITWHDILNNGTFPSDKYVWADESRFSRDHIYEYSHITSW